jgi:hypothetical protein
MVADYSRSITNRCGIDMKQTEITEASPKFLTFSTDVRNLCKERGMEYIDAVVHWCESNNVEIELAANLIKKDPLMKSMIQIEAENLNYLKKTAKLPI